MRKITIVASLLFTLSALSVQAGQVLKISHNNSDKHPAHIAMLQFAKDIQQESGGRFEVQVFPSSVLGNDTTVIEQLQSSLVEFMKVSASFLDNFEDSYSVFSLPYLFSGFDHYHKAMESDVVKKTIYESGVSKGFLGIGYFTSGGRSFYTGKKPILSPDDLQGLKIRVMPSPISIEMVQLLGAHATPLPYGDVYTALQQGLLDGAENNELSLVDMKHGEVAKHYSYDLHAIIPDIVIVSVDFWNDLSDSDRAMFQKNVDKMCTMQIQLWDDAIAASKKVAEEKMGVKFYTVDVRPFQEKVKPIMDRVMQDPKKAELITAILAVQ